MFYTKPTVHEFISTLTDEVLTSTTFIDWARIGEFTESYRREIALLGSLSSKDAVGDLADLLLRYPGTLVLLQALIAHGSDGLYLLDTPSVDFKSDRRFLERQDRKRALELARVFDEMGLVLQLRQMKSVLDYSKGTLVGLEPNKRKNRRGDVFQTHVVPTVISDAVSEINRSHHLLLEIRGGQGSGRKIPFGQRTKFPDFALYRMESERLEIAIEVNFYAASGSKPIETLVGAYPDTQRTLQGEGASLIVISDGSGWRRMKSALKTALERLDYLMNINLAGGGQT